jgi:hypothetical protein
MRILRMRQRGKFELFLGQTHLRRGIMKKKIEAIFSLHVYTRIRCQSLKNLKGTMHNLIAF